MRKSRKRGSRRKEELRELFKRDEKEKSLGKRKTLVYKKELKV